MNHTNLTRRIVRYRVIDLHHQLVGDGKYDEAQLVLRLLRRGTVKLGLYDAAFAAEIALCNIGLDPYYSPNGTYSRFSL